MRNNEAILKINGAEHLYIYGAGLMGKALKKCLTEAPYNKVISGFIVRHVEDRNEFVDGIPVIDVEHAAKYKNNVILVALHEKNMIDAVDILRKNDFSNIIEVSFDSDLWSQIRGNWFRRNVLDNIIACCTSDKNDDRDLKIYVVHSIYDKILGEQSVCQSFEVPIQVGAKLTDKKLFAVRDDEGENISEKNKQYCELTALYWIWKNDSSKYVGLSHYRRKFDLEGESIINALRNGVDVIVTVPVLNFDTVKVQYCKDHEEKDWNILLETISELYPEYLQAAEEVQSGIYYYAYNMFITRKEILDMYCEWLFTILNSCEHKIGVKEDTYQNRYIGFLAERLLTIYLAHNKQYKVVVAPKHFIQDAY